MVAPRVGGVLRAAVVDRRPVPCHQRGGGSVAVCRSLEGRATHAPAHPAPLARGIANALPSLPFAPARLAEPRGDNLAAAPPRKPRACGKRDSEDLGGEGAFGQNAEGGFGLRAEKQGRFWVKSEFFGG
jgi:hypothetical protein